MTPRNKILIHELSGNSSLLRRETADEILEKASLNPIDPSSPIVVDLINIVALAPSFFDQLIGGLKRKYSTSSNPITISFLEVPTHASEKFAAIGRSHKMVLRQTSDNEWSLVESQV